MVAVVFVAVVVVVVVVGGGGGGGGRGGGGGDGLFRFCHRPECLSFLPIAIVVVCVRFLGTVVSVAMGVVAVALVAFVVGCGRLVW